MKQYRILIVATLCAGLLAGYARAEGDGSDSSSDTSDKESRKAEREAFKAANQDEWQAFREEQKAENEEFKKSLEGLTGNARVDAVIKHSDEEFAERLEFKKSMNDARIAQMKENTSDEKQAEMLAKAEERYQEHVTQATERHDEMLAKLKAIKDDTSMTDEQKDAALKGLWEAGKEERQARREKMKEKRGGDADKSAESEKSE